MVLEQAGFTQVADQTAGWIGQSNPFGQVTAAGWQSAGYPIAQEAEEGRSWAELSS